MDACGIVGEVDQQTGRLPGRHQPQAENTAGDRDSKFLQRRQNVTHGRDPGHDAALKKRSASAA